MAYATQVKGENELNRLYAEDLPVHEWYRFVLSFPPHLVRDYLARFGLTPEQRVLDPFCGTGTTIVESKKQGIPSLGLEANPVVHYAARTKADWGVDPDALLAHAEGVAREAERRLQSFPLQEGRGPLFTPDGGVAALRTLSPEQEQILITDSISPRPLHRALVLLEVIEERNDARFYDHERVALAKQLVYSVSNLRFGPEVGVSRVRKLDAPVVRCWLEGVRAMVDDLRMVQPLRATEALVYRADARRVSEVLEPQSIDAVITSPPYPNEKDYSRTTRLESVLLGFMQSRADLRTHKEGLLASNTRNVYVNDETDRWVEGNARVQELAAQIEARRVELGKTSGFEKLYARVVRLYFGGMARHLEELKPKLRPGAHLAYVVGDQASYFRIMIRTGQILAEVAEELGYEIESIDLFRTRFSTATQTQLREEVVVLRWNP